MSAIKKCDKCGQNTVTLNRYCGAWVCNACGHHNGFEKCFCGWSLSGRDGYRELIEDGETIEPDDWN